MRGLSYSVCTNDVAIDEERIGAAPSPDNMVKKS
jgi:hypothetical protein